MKKPKSMDSVQDIARHPQLGLALKPCRLLYVVGQLGLGGLERQLGYFLRALNRERYQPAVIIWSSSPNDIYAHEIADLGVPIYSFPSRTAPWEKLYKLRSLVRRLDPEVIHSYSFHTNIAAWWGALGSTAIPLGSIRNNFLSERRQSGIILGRLSARWPTTQICNSVAAKELVGKCMAPFKPALLYLVRNRLDVHRFSAAPSLPSMPMLLAVGRLYPEKRWDRLIKVIALVRDRGLAFSVRHVGGGPLLEELQTQAKLVGVDARIQFLGPRRDVPALLADSSFLVHTADEEGCPNVVMEAMACGRAVLATDSGDIPLLVEDGKTGFVVGRGDDKALADRLVELVTNPDLCMAMGRNGRKKAEREFDLHSLVTGTLDVYRAAGWRDT